MGENINKFSDKLKNFNQFINENVGHDVWYHGSNKPVDKFLFSLIGKNSDRITNYHGYGIYFVDNIKTAKSYGDIIIKIVINPNSDILEGNITSEQLLKIYNQLIEEGVKLRDSDYKWYNNPTYGEYSVLTDVEEFYDIFMRFYGDTFKSNKEVSEFLIRCGIDGLKVINDVGDKILVIFNEDIIKIVN